MAKSRKPLKKQPLRNVVPDRLDLRDRSYLPAVHLAPPRRLNTLGKTKLRVRDQGETSACTGFALAAVIDLLLTKAGRRRETPVSPFMLYSMARRYDEFRGYKADDGSSCRGALKAWFRHGACADAHWTMLDMPNPNSDPAKDWWQDAARRPLGAYYRVDTRSVTDMQVALNEVGVLFASVVCHEGWEEGYDQNTRRAWEVPHRKVKPIDGGHAIALVGYNERGFFVLNSWGPTWGWSGVAVLPYEDWLANAMDCWVVQLGVATEQHREVAQAVTLRSSHGKVALAADVVLRDREVSPFIVNVENNGELSTSGRFRTQLSDLSALVDIHLDVAIKRWELGRKQAVDIALYAHGGLVGEDGAADTAARWIPALYDARIFPVFIMWETDILSTLKNRLADLLPEVLAPADRRTAGVRDQLQRWWNERLERTFAKPGAICWDEMKQNAKALSAKADGGLRRLYAEFTKHETELGRPVRIHLIGHSAGAIVQSHLTAELIAAGRSIESMVLMAPAVRSDTFRKVVMPHVGTAVKRLGCFMLDDEAEQQDKTCQAMLGYGRSLLYLVSESFETDRRHMPILGMQKYFDAAVGKAAAVTQFLSPRDKARATTHGGFDDDVTTMKSVIAYIKGGA
jgi:hypothetical protein